MIVILGVWLSVGALFGWPRVRARYRETLNKYPNLMGTEATSIKMEAMTDAVLEFLKWMLLGLISGISYFAWLLLELAMQNRKKLEKPSALGAFGFSVLVFILGVLALEKRERN